jgi:hypothetical protein
MEAHRRSLPGVKAKAIYSKKNTFKKGRPTVTLLEEYGRDAPGHTAALDRGRREGSVTIF